MALKKTGVQLVAEDDDVFFTTLAASEKAVQGFAGAAQKAADQVNKAFDDIDRSAKDTAGTYIDANGRLRDANGRFVKSAGDAGDAVKGFGDTADRTFRQMPGLADIATGALHKVGAIAVEAFAAAGRAAIGFFKDSISAAGDFESGMNRFAAVAGGALEESGLALKDFRDQFIQIGKELPVSTAAVQDAAIEMVKGGIEPATIAAGGLKQVIQFAAAADLDLAEASTIAAKALGGWVDQAADAQTKADFLTHSTDLLARAANASTVNVDDLALGLYNVQGTAKLAGVSFDETVTALAQLAPSFSSSADAGTSFKTFLARLQPTTAPAIEAMTELGLVTFNAGKAMQALPTLNLDPSTQSVEEMRQAIFELGISNGMTAKEANALVDSYNTSVFYDAEGNFVGMAEASRLLQGATEGLSEAQRIQALQTIFGQDAIRTAAVFSEQGATGYNNMTEALAKQNSVADMAKQKQAGFNTALDNAKGSMEALQITVGSAVLPLLTKLLNDVIAPGINVLTDLAGALSGDADAFDRLSPPMRDVANGIAEIWEIGQDLIALFQSTSDESSELGAALDDLSGIWARVQVVIDKVMAAYQSIVDAALPIVQGFIEDHGAEIDAFFQKTWDTIIEIVNTALALYEAIVPPVLEGIAFLIEKNGGDIQNIISGVWKAVTAIIDAALTLIAGTLKIALQLIQGDWEGAWTTTKETASRLWDDIKQLIDGQIQIVEGLFGGFVDTIKGLPGELAGVGEAIVNAIWDGLRARWDEFVDWFYGKLQELQDMLPFSEPRDPRSPLRGLGRSGAAIMDMVQRGMDRAGGLTLPAQPQIMPPAIVMPRPVVQMVQPANTSYTTNNNTVNNNRSGGGLGFDHLAALYGGRG